MEKVIISKCENYEPELIKKVVDHIFLKLGGIESFIKPGMKVLIKPNLLIRKKPEEAVTTHPVIIQAIAEKAAAAGAKVIIADSPGGFYSTDILKGIYQVCGYKYLDKISNVELNYDITSKEVSFEEGRVAKRLTIIKPAEEAELIINVPKMKTHMMMTYTGAVKNLFGLIPGVLKAEYHIRMKDEKSFSNLLVDICECMAPSINIMDAVIAMEGQGPSAGVPRHVGLILASTNPFALDVSAAHIIGLDKNDIPTIKRAYERGLPSELNQIEFIGENINECMIKDFHVPNRKREVTFFKNKVFGFITEHIKPKILFDYTKCITCKRCSNHCPAKAITFTGKKPCIDSKKCIKCFCCHELCPQNAIIIKKNWLTRKILRQS